MTLLMVKGEMLSHTQDRKHHAPFQGLIAFCPGCRTIQTVWLDGETMVPTRKFVQEGNKLYHDCGSSQPCDLSHSW